MLDQFALQAADLDPSRARLADLDVQLAARERDLGTFKSELQQLQARYLKGVGALYARLTEIETAVAEEEIRAGLRQPPEFDESADDDAAGTGPDGVPSCSNRSVPSDDLKRVFRDLAKAIHPDLALDEPARCRRHSLMSEANRAYAERDADRLRLILRAWERSPESVPDDDPDADRLRVQRRVAQIDERLVAIETEFADLRASAIGRLQQKIADAKRQGWDLFAEMVLQVKREVARATAQLWSLRRGKVPAGQ
jgi:hypothetical protein